MERRGAKADGEDGRLTGAERRLRGWLYLHALISLVFVVVYVADSDMRIAGFLPNSVAKDGVFLVLSLLGAAHVRRHGWLALVLAAAYAFLIIGEAVALIVGGAPSQTLLGIKLAAPDFLLGWMAIDVVFLVLFVWLYLAAVKARYGLQYLNPIAFLTLIALAEVLVKGEDEVVGADEVALRVDGYMARIKARGRQRVKLAFTVLWFWPLFTLRLPFPAMSPESRLRYLERRFIEDVAQRRTLAPFRPFLQAMIRVASQMAYLGYYGNPKAWDAVGYKPFSEREGGRLPSQDDRPGKPLGSLSSPPRFGRPKYDVLIVGSGAAGSMLAYRFAQAGQRTLVLERGPHVDPRDFGEDEVEQYLRLYNEGALQLATDFRLQVLQGMCVGGGTTINNALCLDPPGAVLDAWTEHGIERAGLENAIGQVRERLTVRTIPDHALSGAARRFAAGAESLNLPGRLEVMEANILPTCVGCGYCNIGCAFGAKLSMLDTMLPWGQQEFPGKLDVLADFEVTEIVHEGDKAIGVRGIHARATELFIGAETVVVSAGPVASSWLLQRSNIGGDRVGRGLHFNINSPLTAEFDYEVDAFAGIQMSHAYHPPGEVPGFLLETWFNPPATQALALPGWFGQHFELMRRYRYLAAGGSLVGTTEPGLVRPGKDAPEIVYEPSRGDLQRVVEGMKLMGRIFLAGGAKRVMPPTFAWHEFSSPASLEALDDFVSDNADLLLTSAHPQGGNPIGEPGRGVVAPDFRVHGFANLFLCDASAFPSSVRVNPQLTVMGLATYAADRILGPVSKAGNGHAASMATTSARRSQLERSPE